MQDLKTIRLSKSMSQKRLAFEAGIDVRTLRRMESGNAVSPESHRAVLVALDMDPARPNAIVPPDAAALVMKATRVIGHVRAAAAETKVRIGAALLLGLLLWAGGNMAYHEFYAPDLRIAMIFGKACDADQWDRTFRAMDREFPEGYDIVERWEGVDSCLYRFEARKPTTEWKVEYFELLQRFKSDGIVASLSPIGAGSRRTPESAAYWRDLMSRDRKNMDILHPRPAATP